MIAALNLPQIQNEVLCVVDVSDIFCYEVLIYFFCEDFSLLKRNYLQSMSNGDCIF